MNSISVVIPNFNGKGLLEKNLPSVFVALKNSGIEFEVIVSDDGSTDNSVQFLKAFYPQITLVENRKNSGFSSNVNSGLRAARYDLVLALNNDVSLAPDYFKPLLYHFESKDTFGVMGALLAPDSDLVTDGAKLAEQSPFGVIRSTKNILRLDGGALFTFFLSGANALMDRQKLAVLGYFDEIFNPFYNEDVELSLRAWRLGWKCIFEPNAHAYHACSSTIRSVADRARIRRISLRNRFILHDIHLESHKRTLFFLKLFLDVLLRWITLDWNFYQAYLDYRSRKETVVTSRGAFKNLKPCFSLSQIIASVRREQLKSPHRVFS